MARICEQLVEAIESHARVRFEYLPPFWTGGPESCTVEPAFVVVHLGRYYLLAYDGHSGRHTSPHSGWEWFPLDRIVTTDITKCGTFRPRPVPDQLNRSDYIGFVADLARTPHEVTVHVSRELREFVASRIWQHQQDTQRNPDGTADITFSVTDDVEQIAWAFSFCGEVTIVEPAETRRYAAFISNLIAAQYWSDPPELPPRTGTATPPYFR